MMGTSSSSEKYITQRRSSYHPGHEFTRLVASPPPFPIGSIASLPPFPSSVEAMSFFTLKVHAIGLTDLLVDKLIFLDDTLPSLPYETSCHLRTT